jgi:hypothetical protein
MRSPAARTSFTVASFLPIAGIFAISAWAATFASRTRMPTQDDVIQMLIGVVVGACVVAFLQIGLGIAVALHVTRRPDLSSTERAVWTIACIFVGSLALPLFSLIVLPKVKDLPAAPS